MATRVDIRILQPFSDVILISNQSHYRSRSGTADVIYPNFEYTGSQTHLPNVGLGTETTLNSTLGLGPFFRRDSQKLVMIEYYDDNVG